MQIDKYLMKNVEQQPPTEQIWNIRQALIDMASNLDQSRICGTYERNRNIDMVESEIDILVNSIFENLNTKVCSSCEYSKVEDICNSEKLKCRYVGRGKMAFAGSGLFVEPNFGCNQWKECH